MQNVVVNMCEKFHNDRLRNDRALGNGNSDNNKTKTNTKKNRNKNNTHTHRTLFTENGRRKKLGFGVTQGHRKRHHSIEHIRLYIRLP